MGNFSSKLRGIDAAIRNAATRVFHQRPRVVPQVFRSQFHQAQKRNLRQMTRQAIHIRPMRIQRIRPPIPGLYRPTIGYSPHFGKLLPEAPRFKNFTLVRPRSRVPQQLFKQGPRWRYSEAAHTFLLNHSRSPLTTLSRHTSASLVGARSILVNKGEL